MRIETLKALTGASLLNTPAITSFYNPVFDANKVKRGDLFFAYEYDDIPKAVENGAYGIIVDRVVEILDSEIAWLRVDELKTASKKLLRYHLEEHEKQFYYVDCLGFELLEQMVTDKNIVFLRSGINDLAKIFGEKQVFICCDRSFLNSFTKDISYITQLPQEYTPLPGTLFESSFIYDNRYYQKVAIPPFFVDKLVSLIDFAKGSNMAYNVEKLHYSSYFYPQFCDRNLQSVEFGKSSRVLIFSDEFDAIKDYCDKHLGYLKVLYLEDFANLEQLYEQLQESFDYAVIAGVRRTVLDSPPFLRPSASATLF